MTGAGLLIGSIFGFIAGLSFSWQVLLWISLGSILLVIFFAAGIINLPNTAKDGETQGMLACGVLFIGIYLISEALIACISFLFVSWSTFVIKTLILIWSQPSIAPESLVYIARNVLF